VDYLAPAAPPSVNPIALTAISRADPSRSATASVSIVVSTGSIAVAISPQYAFLAPSTGTLSTQQFFATVTGAANTAVSWTVQTGASGLGCAEQRSSHRHGRAGGEMNECRRSHSLFRISVALVLFAVTSSGAAPTALVRMSVAQISRTARSIVRARCIANVAIWDSGEIWTRTTFEVEESWSGTSPSGRIVVRLLGGTIGNITSRVSGIPRFVPGEDAVLFLEPSRYGDFSIVSWQQGTFRIRRNHQTGGEIVTQDTASFATYDPVSRHFEAAGIRSMRLADFRSLVDAALSVRTAEKP
jgi:hypothetical protein